MMDSDLLVELRMLFLRADAQLARLKMTLARLEQVQEAVGMRHEPSDRVRHCLARPGGGRGHARLQRHDP